MKRSLALFLVAVLPAAAFAAPLKIEKGDQICIIGNALGERMQHHGWLETLIHSRFPGHELVFRNLAVTGDEIVTRLRSAGFGSPDEHLRIHKADVLFAFFGYNESFAGRAGLEKFGSSAEFVGRKRSARSAHCSM